MRNSVVPIVEGREIVRLINTPTPKYPGSAREIGGLKGKAIQSPSKKLYAALLSIG
jgi:hypothetical protein